MTFFFSTAMGFYKFNRAAPSAGREISGLWQTAARSAF